MKPWVQNLLCASFYHFKKRVFNTQESSWQPSQSGSRSPGSAVSHLGDPPTITNLPSTSSTSYRSTFNTTSSFNTISNSSSSAPPVLPPRRPSGRRSRSRPSSENAGTNSDPLRLTLHIELSKSLQLVSSGFEHIQRVGVYFSDVDSIF